MKRRNNFDQDESNVDQQNNYGVPRQIEAKNSFTDFANGNIS